MNQGHSIGVILILNHPTTVRRWSALYPLSFCNLENAPEPGPRCWPPAWNLSMGLDYAPGAGQAMPACGPFETNQRVPGESTNVCRGQGGGKYLYQGSWFTGSTRLHLGALADAPAGSKTIFRKAINASHSQRVINVDKNAAYHATIDSHSKADGSHGG